MKEKYIISNTVEHQTKILQQLEKLGYMWQSKKKPTNLIPLEEAKNEVIYLYEEYKTLTYSDLDYLYAGGRDEVIYLYEEYKYEELYNDAIGTKSIKC